MAGQLPAGLYQEQGRPHAPNSLDTSRASGGAELGGGVLLRALAFMPFAALPLVQSVPWSPSELRAAVCLMTSLRSSATSPRA